MQRRPPKGLTRRWCCSGSEPAWPRLWSRGSPRSDDYGSTVGCSTLAGGEPLKAASRGHRPAWRRYAAVIGPDPHRFIDSTHRRCTFAEVATWRCKSEISGWWDVEGIWTFQMGFLLTYLPSSTSRYV